MRSKGKLQEGRTSFVPCHLMPSFRRHSNKSSGIGACESNAWLKTAQKHALETIQRSHLRSVLGRFP
jgi:hypothetical protein